METVVSGTAERNVRITGKVVRIEGSIEGNLMILADTVTISNTASIGGTVRLIADKAILKDRSAVIYMLQQAPCSPWMEPSLEMPTLRPAKH